MQIYVYIYVHIYIYVYIYVCVCVCVCVCATFYAFQSHKHHNIAIWRYHWMEKFYLAIGKAIWGWENGAWGWKNEMGGNMRLQNFDVARNRKQTLYVMHVVDCHLWIREHDSWENSDRSTKWYHLNFQLYQFPWFFFCYVTYVSMLFNQGLVLWVIWGAITKKQSTHTHTHIYIYIYMIDFNGMSPHLELVYTKLLGNFVLIYNCVFFS